jgi:hypothetical protein
VVVHASRCVCVSSSSLNDTTTATQHNNIHVTCTSHNLLDRQPSDNFVALRSSTTVCYTWSSKA